MGSSAGALAAAGLALDVDFRAIKDWCVVASRAPSPPPVRCRPPARRLGRGDGTRRCRGFARGAGTTTRLSRRGLAKSRRFHHLVARALRTRRRHTRRRSPFSRRSARRCVGHADLRNPAASLRTGEHCAACLRACGKLDGFETRLRARAAPVRISLSEVRVLSCVLSCILSCVLSRVLSCAL